VLRAHAFCLSGFLVIARQAQSTKQAHRADGQLEQSPVFLSLLCALCSCFVLRASCSCFVLIRFFGHRPPSRKHKARSIHTVTLPRRSRSHENWVFLSRMAKQKAQSMSTKQPILTKRCDFEQKARSAKHKAQSMSTKQRQKNEAQATAPAHKIGTSERAASGELAIRYVSNVTRGVYEQLESRTVREFLEITRAPRVSSFYPELPNCSSCLLLDAEHSS
jgi:hypothetical protein